jgi:3-polyprenyl-4-hydroxybenzoate decarboxylase
MGLDATKKWPGGTQRAWMASLPHWVFESQIELKGTWDVHKQLSIQE